MGEHRFNTRDYLTKKPKPESEHAIMAVPPIVSKADYDAVRAHLASRNPKWTPPRVSSGPNLLTGICFCGACGGAMTLRTGKGSAGGQYRYYACSTSGLHFHDLRGTAITMLAEAGCTVAQIVAITHHSLETATRILEVYLSPTRHLADQAIEQFENAQATRFANQLQTAAGPPITEIRKKG